jgi:lamin tail-like protein/phospholipase D-like protein
LLFQSWLHVVPFAPWRRTGQPPRRAQPTRCQRSRRNQSWAAEDFAGRLHDKYAVVDAGTTSDPLIVTGSTNWTANAVEANDENLLIVHDAGLTSAFMSDFARVRSAISSSTFACNAGPMTTPTVSNYLPLAQAGPSSADQTATAVALTQTAAALGTPSPSSTPTATPTMEGAGGVAIIFVLYNPSDTLSEYVQIRNNGSSAVDMTSWPLRDLANNTYTFPAFTLPAGAEVKVWTNTGTNDAANLYWGRAQAAWNNTGDTAILRNAQGVEVSRYSYL